MKLKTLLPARLLVTVLALAAVSAWATNRSVVITAPTTARPGESVHVTIAASTDATDGEQIGFFHPEYSVDGGKSWITVYAEKVGRAATRAVDFQAGAEGTKALVRVRIAFRGGKAGDVDFTGAPIAWGGSWGTWATPPAKHASISVTAH